MKWSSECRREFELPCTMLKLIAICFSILFLNECAHAQNYTFSPSENYNGELSMDMYTEHYMYIGHNLPDTAFITWRVVGNTCPEEWDIQACDYQHCYTGLPNDGDMNGVPPGGQGYLRMIVNPYTVTGSGMLHLLIYPTGQPGLYTEAFFNFSTPSANVSIHEDGNEKIVFQSGEIFYSGNQRGNFRLYNLSGAAVAQWNMNAPSGSYSLKNLDSGIYVVTTPNGKTYTFFNPAY